MAPEQSTGDPVGPTADIYSLGCMLYEMLAGEPPFTGPNAMAIMAKHLMETVPSVRVVRNTVPVEVEEAIFHVLAKAPVDRPKSAQAFAEMLGATAGGPGMRRTPRPSSSMRGSIAMRGSVAMRGSQMMPRQTTQAPLFTIDEAGEFIEVAPVAWWKRPTTILAAALVMVGAVGGWAYLNRGSGAVVVDDPNARRIAVLYFNDLSRDSSLAPVADGLTEGLIRALGSSSGISVIQRSGVEPFRGAALGIDSIARVLGVGFLVRGDLEPENDRLRVGIRLVDASGVEVDRRAFTVPADSALLLQDSVATVAGELIRTKLGTEIRLKEQRAATASAPAWLAAQRGLQAQRALEQANAARDADGVERAYRTADSLFAVAGELDPRWGEPHTLRAALAYRRARIVGTDPGAIRPWIDSGMVHVESALRLDRRSADAAEVRGNLKYWSWLAGVESDAGRRVALLASAKADLDSATSWNPNQAGAWATLSHLYYQLPKVPTSDVLLAAERALAVDEFLANANTVRMRVFLAAYDLGQFDKAKQACRELQRRFPEDARTYRCQLYLLTTPQAFADPSRPGAELAAGWRLADSLVARSAPAARVRDSLTARMLMAATLARASLTAPGLEDSARRVARSAEGDATVDPTRELAFFGSFAATILDDRPGAFRLLREYLAVNPQRAASLSEDEGWWFRSIAQEGEFRRLVGKQP